MSERAADFAAKPGSVSVAMATYNGAQFLSQQLSSIASQTRPPDELVVSDDASSDKTIEIVENFAKTVSFPVIVRRNDCSVGFRANFMTCAELCTSELVAFCDQDDIWMPNKLAVQGSDFADSTIMLSCHNADLIDRSGELLKRRLDQFAKTCRLDLRTAGPLTFPRGFTQMTRRKLFKWEWLRQASVDIGDVNQIMSHDGWLFFVALLHGAAIYHQDPLACYRQHGTNASGAVPSRQAKLKAKFSSRSAADFDRLACVWTNRSQMLRTLLEKEPALDDDIKNRVRQAIDGYDRSASAARHRNRFHTTAERSSKAKLLLEAIGRGEFRPQDPWVFPLEGAIKDAASIFLS